MSCRSCRLVRYWKERYSRALLFVTSGKGQVKRGWLFQTDISFCLDHNRHHLLASSYVAADTVLPLHSASVSVKWFKDLMAGTVLPSVSFVLSGRLLFRIIVSAYACNAPSPSFLVRSYSSAFSASSQTTKCLRLAYFRPSIFLSLFPQP